MGTSFGRKANLATTGNPVEVIADGRYHGMKLGGVTIDWTTITAVSGSDATLADGTVVKIGDKYMRYGTVLAKITTGGKYGPSKTNAADGRQTLTRGSCYILNSTVVESELGSDHPPVFDNSTGIYLDRLLTNEAEAAVNNPTEANVLAAFPSVVVFRE